MSCSIIYQGYQFDDEDFKKYLDENGISYKTAKAGVYEPVKDTQYTNQALKGLPQAFINDMIHGMSYTMLGNIYTSERDLVQGIEGGKVSGKKIYDKLLDSMTDYYESNNPGENLASKYNERYINAKGDPGKQKDIRTELMVTRALWKTTKKNWPAFVEKQKESLRILNIKFSNNEDGDITLDDIEDYTPEDQRNPNEYMRDDMKHDAKKGSAAAFKLAVATIPDSQFSPDGKVYSKIDNSLAKLPKLANYSSVFNYALYTASNTNGLFNIYDKLIKTAADPAKLINANLQRLVDRIQLKDGFAGKSLPDIRFALQAESALMTQRPGFIKQYIDPNGFNHNQQTVINNKSTEIKSTWYGSMKTSDAVKASGKDFIFKAVPKNETDIDFANKLGISITKKDLDKLTPSVRNSFNVQLSQIKGLVSKMAAAGTKVGFLGKESLDFDTRLSTLADLYTIHISGDDTQSNHLNLENKNTANFIRNNALSYILNDANSSGTLDEFLQKQPAMTDIFRKDSVVLNKVIFKDGKFSKPVTFTLTEGLNSIQGGTPNADLTIHQRTLHQFNDNLNGYFYALVPADGKNEPVIDPGNFISPDAFFKGNRGSATANYFGIMHDYLNTEIALAKDFADNPNRSNIVNLQKKDGDRLKGNSLRFFKDLLPKETVDSIHSDVIDGEKPLSEVLPVEDFNKYIGAWTGASAKDVLDNFIESKIFNHDIPNDTYTLNGIDRDFITKYLDSDKNRTQYSGKLVTELMKFREMNYIIGNIEMHKLLYGDPAEFDIKDGKTDELKRTKSFLGGVEPLHVDNEMGERGLNGRLNSILNMAHGDIPLEPKDPGYHVHKNYANTLTLRDINIRSKSYPEMAKLLGEQTAKPYKVVNEADAQAIQSPTHYREVMYKTNGNFPEKQEADFQRHFAIERQYKASTGEYKYTNPTLEKADAKVAQDIFGDDKVSYQILKLKAAGPAFVDGTTVNQINKASWAPQFHDWVRDTQNGELYNAMQKAGIDYVMVESAHKIGVVSDSLVDLYDENGKINVEGIKNATPQQIPHEILGVQVQQQTKSDKVTEGSQLRSLAPVDLYSTAVPLDYIQKFKGDEDSARVSWKDLSETEKRGQSPIHKLISDYEDTLEAMANKRVANKMDEIGAVDHGNDTYSIPDKSKISKFLKNEMTRRELPENVKAGLEVGGDGEFLTPLEASARYKEIRSILYSIPNKTIIRAKINGKQLTTRAVTGFERGARERDADGNLLSSELAFYRKGEDGKTLPAEALVPYYFGKAVRDKMQEIHRFKTDQEFLDHLHKELMKTQEGKDLLSHIQFRIPTEGTNSVEHTITKRFLPQQMGDMIVNASEITAKSGLDMDIDKQNVYIYNHYVDKNTGLPKKIKFRNIDTNNPEDLKNYYEESGMLEDRREFEAYMQSPVRFAQNALDKGLEESSAPDYVPTLDEFIEQSKGKSSLELNSIQALENRHLDLLREIMSLPEKYKALVTPNDTTPDKNVSKEITKLLHIKGEDKGTYGSLLYSPFMAKKRQAFLDAKGGIGISATSNTSHAIGQLSNLVYGGDVELRLPHNKAEGGISMSSINDVNGNLISANIARTISGFADITKSEHLPEMNMNYNTTKNFLVLLRAGVPMETTALFNNQPAILKYLELQSIHNNVSAINKRVKQLGPTKLWQATAKFFGSIGKDIITNKVKVRPIPAKFIKPSTYSKAEMISMMHKYNVGGKLTEAENIRQLQMLDDYLQYNSMAWDLFRRQQGSNWATDSGGDPNDVRRKQLLYKRAQGLPFTSVNSTFNSTYIGGYRDNTLKMNEILKQALPIQTGKSGDILDGQARDINNIVHAGLFDNRALKGELSILDHGILNQTLVNGSPISKLIPQLMTGDLSVANWVKAMQNSANQRLRNNPFLLNIFANTDKRPDYPHSIDLKQKAFDTYTSNLMTDALRDIRNDQDTEVTVNGITKTPTQIYNGMKMAAILQQGPKGWAELIPNEDYGPMVRGAIDRLDGSLNHYYENSLMFRKLWADDKLVPILPKVYREDERDPSVAIEVKPEITDAKFREALNSPSSVIQVEWWPYRNNNFIKTVDYPKKDKEGNTPDKVVKLYQKVATPTELGKDYWSRKSVFKEINKLAAPNVKESYEDKVESVLPTNPHVEELDDDQINDALIEAKFPGTDTWTISDALRNRLENEAMNEGEGRDDQGDGSDSDWTPPDDVSLPQTRPVVNQVPKDYDEAIKNLAQKMLKEDLEKNPRYYLSDADKLSDDEIEKAYKTGPSALTRITMDNYKDAQRVENEVGGDMIMNGKHKYDVIPDYYNDSEIEVGGNYYIEGLNTLMSEYIRSVKSVNPEPEAIEAFRDFAKKNGLGQWISENPDIYNPNQLSLFDRLEQQGIIKRECE